ncbi:MAG TPA: AraC family transcriptional regulator [Candidatus Baltobacteraceae bacterium]|nr:AraC family transcriptional regulator [Candidatus Baltobacteraceae bacterium]
MSKIDPSFWWSLRVHEVGFKLNGPEWCWRDVRGPFWRLYANRRDGDAVEIDRTRYPLGPRRVLLIPENVPYHCLPKGSARRLVPHLWIHFSIQPAVQAPRQGPIIIKSDTGLNDCIERLLRHKLELHAPDGKTVPPDAETAPPDAQLYHLCAGLLHECFARAKLHAGPNLPPRLRSLLELIEHSLDHPLPNAFLAARMGMSVEAFIRLFRRTLDTTPAAYLTERRLQEACRRLTFTDETIEMIAEATGYANRHHFSHVFGRHLGCGPAAFRLRR